MKIELEHHFKHKCIDVEKLFDEVKMLSKFMKNLNIQAISKPDHYAHDKYKGDAFEALVECLIKLSPIDRRINIIDYHPTEIDEKGVDGTGKSIDNEIHCVQIKYRSDTNHLLTEHEDNIAMFPAYSSGKYKAKYLTLFTTAKDLHRNLENFNDDNFQTFNYKKLSGLLDDNQSFWKEFKELLLTK